MRAKCNLNEGLLRNGGEPVRAGKHGLGCEDELSTLLKDFKEGGNQMKIRTDGA